MDEPNILIDTTICFETFFVRLQSVCAVGDKHGYSVRISANVFQGVEQNRQIFRITAQPGFIADNDGNV